MPTYEYRCKQCGEHLEVVQSFSDDPLTECPNCGGELRKVFGSVGIVFKGSGFYKTDSRSGSGSSKPSEPAAPAAKSESSTAEKSTTPEPKPAAAPEKSAKTESKPAAAAS